MQDATPDVVIGDTPELPDPEDIGLLDFPSPSFVGAAAKSS